MDDPKRGTYLRWSLFAPSVIEPGSMAKGGGWEVKESSTGWGSYEAMLGAMEGAISKGPFVLGETFSMADVIFGGTLGYLLQFKSIEARPSFVAYSERLGACPAALRAAARNAAIRAEHALG